MSSFIFGFISPVTLSVSLNFLKRDLLKWGKVGSFQHYTEFENKWPNLNLLTLGAHGSALQAILMYKAGFLGISKKLIS